MPFTELPRRTGRHVVAFTDHDIWVSSEGAHCQKAAPASVAAEVGSGISLCFRAVFAGASVLDFCSCAPLGCCLGSTDRSYASILRCSSSFLYLFSLCALGVSEILHHICTGWVAADSVQTSFVDSTARFVGILLTAYEAFLPDTVCMNLSVRQPLQGLAGESAGLSSSGSLQLVEQTGLHRRRKLQQQPGRSCDSNWAGTPLPLCSADKARCVARRKVLSSCHWSCIVCISWPRCGAQVEARSAAARRPPAARSARRPARIAAGCRRLPWRTAVPCQTMIAAARSVLPSTCFRAMVAHRRGTQTRSAIAAATGQRAAARPRAPCLQLSAWQRRRGLRACRPAAVAARRRLPQRRRRARVRRQPEVQPTATLLPRRSAAVAQADAGTVHLLHQVCPQLVHLDLPSVRSEKLQSASCLPVVCEPHD